ncbi:peptidase M28-like protein [Pontibacter ummariensis]|uniref:Peptidase family M28 n=1 Tax=Pontibacter ummariensis TaxID=1610492 RepID=A0A239D4X2_9BACT|nr:M20/M25/M40 family metallo-hydrolase [Pontibacter ummariensis]PRY14254.1 peptidase M28-like protein [Pontibacter ummariensis]SNS27465.1 Peptidase family M28 [Pontibacter ummariensis]
MKKNLSALVLACSLSTAVSAQNLKTITKPEVTRIVKTLSADEMQGRASFTPGVEKAAQFIQGELKRIGLKPLPGEDDLLQSFTVYRVSPKEKEASLNGQKVQADNLFAITDKKELEWENNGKQKVVTVGANDNFRTALGELNKEQQDVLVLVDPKHEEIFRRYQHYLGQGSVKQQLGAGGSKVFVLTEQRNLASYEIEIENNIEELQLTNVAGMIEGKRKDEFVVFSGHYDHIGIQETIAGDSIANGADDDAAGTTAMMMLADYYRQQRKPERSLIFVAFAAEEIGGFGSKYFSEQLNPDDIVAMFNIEMVGKPSKFGPNSAYLTGFERSNLGELMQKRLQGTTYSIHPDPYPEQNLFYRSDNATLARLGVPAHTISSVQIDQDKTYHTVNDELEQLDMEHLTNMIKAIALGSKGVVSGEDTPTRVDKSQVR